MSLTLPMTLKQGVSRDDRLRGAPPRDLFSARHATLHDGSPFVPAIPKVLLAGLITRSRKYDGKEEERGAGTREEE